MQRLQANGDDLHDPRDDRDAILTNEMEHTDTSGGERVALHALQLLKFSKILHALHFNRNQIHWATALVVGRMLSPGSERQTYEWMMERSSILDLLDAKIPSTRSLYDVGDLLYTHREAIMEGLFGNTKALLGFDETIMFYDLTNTFYMGRQQGELLQFGHRKEKRSHCLLVTFALVLDGSGFPRTAKILPSNASEPKTLKQAIAQWRRDQPTVIMDAGTLSEANLADLKEQGLGWICVERSKTPPVPEASPKETFQATTKTWIRAWSLGVKEEELRVYLHSEAKQAIYDQILETKRRAFEAEIAYSKEGLSIQGRPKRSAVIEKKIGRLTEKYKKVANPYEVRVIKNKKGTTATSIRMQKRSAFDEGTDASGGYVIRTSHTDWDGKTVAQTYWRWNRPFGR